MKNALVDLTLKLATLNKLKLKYMKKTISIVICLLVCISATAQKKYFLCFTENENSKLKLSIAYEKGKAVYVKYKGQDESMRLKYVKETYQGRNTMTTYSEQYRGKVNGTYVITHSGNWDYVTYIRKRDNKKFEFTIDHESSIVNEEYRRTPCY